MIALVALAGVALAGGIALEVSPEELAAQRLTFAAYSGQTYVGLLQVDGMAEEGGGATLVARFLAPGSQQPTWIEGVTVDEEGELVKVVRREGRRIRSLVVEGDAVREEIREGGADGAVVAERSHALGEGPLSSPWLVPLAIPLERVRKGDTWAGTLVDGAVLSPEAATLTWQGRAELGGKRDGELGVLVRDSATWSMVVADEELAAIAPATGMQWVAGPRAELHAAHTAR